MPGILPHLPDQAIPKKTIAGVVFADPTRGGVARRTGGWSRFVLVESRDALPSQTDPRAHRWVREYPLSQMPAGHVVSQLPGHTVDHLRVDELRVHMVRIR